MKNSFNGIHGSLDIAEEKINKINEPEYCNRTHLRWNTERKDS